MSKDIQQLLQDCLEGYDAGLTPEECLMAYPAARAQLEPLFRQAISLRVAYAASPRPEFKFQAREKLLFAAGRDVTVALSSEPSEEFVTTTRQRLLNRAGATAQEALRDVPPPQLPFWANARRHLLEVAATAPPKPQPSMSIALRSALSAAVVVLAVAIAGAGFFLQDTPANQPSLAAELNFLTEQMNTYEQLRASGQPVSASLLDDLAIRTSRLAEQYAAASPNSDAMEKLPELIQRQQSFLAEEGSLDETLAAAQARLNEADQRLAAANAAETATAEPTNTPDTSVAIAPTTEPTVEPTPEPVATEEIEVPDVAIVTSEELSSRQVVVQFETSETALGLSWLRVTTDSLTFVMPDSWSITNLEEDENGIVVIETDALFIQTDIDGMMLIVSTLNGEVNTAAGGEAYMLRGEGENGTTVTPEELIKITGLADNWASLYNMLVSLKLTGE